MAAVLRHAGRGVWWPASCGAKRCASRGSVFAIFEGRGAAEVVCEGSGAALDRLMRTEQTRCLW